ncbi:hypothetical protein LOCC1_G000451 [Lachnellula occidentalis]|uniref:DUF7707 domain-containing protein n=1 Tax=Lachnellula occidentalis TaxID=215460 RepID=A0A8H8S9M2_9HELO|nr:hypothetical protein LOCC1_G000451 [Lachnellula occidentalis]
MTVAAVATTLYTLGAQAQTYTIDPSSVPIATRDAWCTTQKQICPALCTQISSSSTTSQNNCYPESLTYSCVCGNGASPNASEFSQTLPYFICTEYDAQCITACNGNTDCQSDCRSQHPCGAQNPVRVNTSTSSMMASTTAGGGASNTQVYNGLGGAATTTAASGKKSDAQSALDIGRSYGLAVVFAGIFAGFALVM